jgi:16S rRNA (adenine1518-N6/adenine1519-N6)-dimethyltransferase
MINLTDKHTVMELLSKHHLWADKRKGQNFLVDRWALNKIITAADLSKKDLVIEVGPGLGVLTRELCYKAGQVLAIEVDEIMTKILRETCRSCKNLKIIRKNIFNIDIESELKKAKKARYKVVANIPYNITSAILEFFLDHKFKPNEMILTVQKEVAERICAKSGKMSILAVSVQLYGKPELIAEMKKDSFFPVPRVDSAIIKIGNIKYPPRTFDTRLFFRIVKAGFSVKRKQLHNSLSGGLAVSTSRAVAYLTDARIASSRRAEELSIEEWKKLYEAIKNE